MLSTVARRVTLVNAQTSFRRLLATSYKGPPLSDDDNTNNNDIHKRNKKDQVTSSSTSSSFSSSSTSPTSKVPPHKDGLYFGQFTKEEYEAAAKAIREQIAKLENDIKGDHNIREKLGKIAQFPQRSPEGASPTDIKSLSDFFRQTIKLTGPIPLSAYMRQCLTHPDFGYYTTRDPLNLKTGDFITSPEISSVFGEMIGIWFFNIWQTSKGKTPPKNIRFIEFGPGKGTLIHDVLHTFNKFVTTVSDIKPKIEIVMIEASPFLRKEQQNLLCDTTKEFKKNDAGFDTSVTKWGNDIIWVDTEKSIPKGGSGKDGNGNNINADDDNRLVNYIIAHEFFDALPIKSFIRQEEGWRELVVEHTPSVDTSSQLKLETRQDPQTHFISTSDGLSRQEQEQQQEQKQKHEQEQLQEQLDTEFHLSISPKETPSSMIPKISKRYKDLPVGTRIEICPDAELFIMKIAQLVSGNVDGSGDAASFKGQDEGAALVVDYGPSSEIPENTLRGIYQHKFVSPFYKPGEVDLSVDVDFQNLKNLTEAVCNVYGPIQQGDWLHNIGIGYRVDQLLKKNANDEEMQDKIYGAYRRLVDDDQMGKVYKFMALLPKGAQKPIGF